MTYLYLIGDRNAPWIVEDDYWNDEWGSRYYTKLPYYEGHPIDPKYLPSSGYMKSRAKTLDPFVPLPWWMCTVEVRDAISSVEPNVHGFFPFPVRRTKTSKEIVANYFTINICNSLPVFDPTRTDPYLFHKVEGRPKELGDAFVLSETHIGYHVKDGVAVKLAVDEEIMQGHQLAIDPRVGFGKLFVSDAMHKVIQPFIEKRFFRMVKTV